MEKSKVKRAHIIPESYMLPWADESGEVYVADIEKERALILRSSNATIVKYAYKPAVLTHDREEYYSQIESRGITAIRAICEGSNIDSVARRDITDFMEMFIERGLYADQADLLVPAMRGSFGSDTVEDIELNLGDMISLHRDLNQEDASLREAGIENWPWHVVTQPHPMMTGDGAVIHIWHGERLATVLFPLTPFQLLVIGEEHKDLKLSITECVASFSRRWLVGRPQDAPDYVLAEDQKRRPRKYSQHLNRAPEPHAAAAHDPAQ